MTNLQTTRRQAEQALHAAAARGDNFAAAHTCIEKGDAHPDDSEAIRLYQAAIALLAPSKEETP